MSYYVRIFFYIYIFNDLTCLRLFVLIFFTGSQQKAIIVHTDFVKYLNDNYLKTKRVDFGEHNEDIENDKSDILLKTDSIDEVLVHLHDETASDTNNTKSKKKKR